MRKARRSLWYSIWQWLLCRCLELFYRRMEANGLHNIPKDRPVIFASNHTNALMDPLVITYFSGKQHYFMTRGDVFNIRIIGAIFRSWRMLPLFRMKDGIDTLSKNNEVMELATQKMVEGHSMIIFPEGSHFWKRFVHPLRKGLVRMAFDVLEKDPNSELVIIPVGLYYNEMIHLNQDVLVNFGTPIVLKDFPKGESTQKTYHQFNEHLRELMKEQLIHIDLDGPAYDQVERWRVELSERLACLPLKESYQYQKEFIRVVSDKAFQAGMPDWPFTLDEILSRHELREWWKKIELKLFPPAWSSKLATAIKYPFYWLSFLHFVPIFFLAKQLLSKIKDITFHCSVKFGLALLIQPIFALIQGSILAAVLGNWWILPLYMVSMPLWATLFTEWRGRIGYPH